MKDIQFIRKVFFILVVASFFSLGNASANPFGSIAGANNINNYKPASTPIILPLDTSDKKIKAFKKEWEHKIDKLNKEIARDEHKIKKAKSKDQQRLNEELKDLKSKTEELQQEVNAAGNKSGMQWKQFKMSIHKKYRMLDKQMNDFLKNK